MVQNNGMFAFSEAIVVLCVNYLNMALSYTLQLKATDSFEILVPTCNILQGFTYIIPVIFREKRMKILYEHLRGKL